MITTALPKIENLPIDEEERTLFAARARNYLSEPATDPEIKHLLAILQGGLKWPGGEVIHNKVAYLTALHQSLKWKRLAPAIIEQGVRRTLAKYTWMPAARELIDECEAALREIEAGLLFLEAPAQERFAASYGVAMRLISHDEAATRLRRERLRAIKEKKPNENEA
jgi:hypothetical protein